MLTLGLEMTHQEMRSTKGGFQKTLADNPAARRTENPRENYTQAPRNRPMQWLCQRKVIVSHLSVRS